MGVQKRTRKYAKVKRVIGQKDARLYVRNEPIYAYIGPPSTLDSLPGVHHRKKNQGKGEAESKRKVKGDEVVREM